MTAPLDPSSTEAQRLLEQELAKAEYQASKPGLIDQLATNFWNWLTSIKFGSVSGAPALAIVVLLVIVVGVIVVLLLVYGVPRLNRRASSEQTLFGDDDTRDAATLRASAAAAAARGDFAQAVVEAYRALARGLSERGVLEVTPGTTARAFAVRAGERFPDLATAIGNAAGTFDDVRYLDRPGTPDGFAALTELDRALERSTPTPVPGPLASTDETSTDETSTDEMRVPS